MRLFVCKTLKYNYLLRPFSLVTSKCHFRSHPETRSKKRPVGDCNDEDIEGKYEESLPVNGNKKTRYLLPIKTKKGLVPRSIEVLGNYH